MSLEMISALFLLLAVFAHIMGFSYDFGYFKQWGINISDIPYQWYDTIVRALEVFPAILIIAIVYLIFRPALINLSPKGEPTLKLPESKKLSRLSIAFYCSMYVFGLFGFMLTNLYPILFMTIALAVTTAMTYEFGLIQQNKFYYPALFLLGTAAVMAGLGSVKAWQNTDAGSINVTYENGSLDAKYVAWLNAGLVLKNERSEVIFIDKQKVVSTSYGKPTPKKSTGLIDKPMEAILSIFR